MKQRLHSNASLTIPQRVEVKRLFEIEKVSVAELADRFCVGETTIRRWINRDSPLDKSSAPANLKRKVTADYRQAVIEHRQANPTRGAQRIAFELKTEYSTADRGTVTIILKENGLIRPISRVKTSWQIPVGRHRLQCDVQELPAVKGNQGSEYSIRFIHLKTRWKYSEIHPDQRSQTIASV